MEGVLWWDEMRELERDGVGRLRCSRAECNGTGQGKCRE
jgi:hypothetical protein